MNYENKYNKYKLKYLRLKKKIVGATNNLVDKEYEKTKIIEFISESWYDVIDKYSLKEPSNIYDDEEIKLNINLLFEYNRYIYNKLKEREFEIDKRNFIVNIILEEIDYNIKITQILSQSLVQVMKKKFDSESSKDMVSPLYKEDIKDYFSVLPKDKKLMYIQMIAHNIRLVNLYKLLIVLAKNKENNKVFDSDDESLNKNIEIYYLLYSGIQAKDTLFYKVNYLKTLIFEINNIYEQKLLSEFKDKIDFSVEPHSLDNSDEIYEYVFFYHIFSKKETLNDKDINKLKDIMYNRRNTLNNTLTINLKGQIINIDGELKNDDIKNNLEKEENKKTKLEIERFVEELNLLSTDIFSNLKEYIKHISYLKNKINEFFEKSC